MGFWSAVGRGIGKAANFGMHGALKTFEGIGSASIWTANKIGNGTWKAGEKTFDFTRRHVQDGSLQSAAKRVAYGTADNSRAFFGSFVKHIPDKGYRLSGLGWGAFIGATAITSVQDANDEYMNTQTGVWDSEMTDATPRIPAYANNGNASGDLVFALHANRRG